jgi:hypothetical protein
MKAFTCKLTEHIKWWSGTTTNAHNWHICCGEIRTVEIVFHSNCIIHTIISSWTPCEQVYVWRSVQHGILWINSQWMPWWGASKSHQSNMPRMPPHHYFQKDSINWWRYDKKPNSRWPLRKSDCTRYWKKPSPVQGFVVRQERVV